MNKEIEKSKSLPNLWKRRVMIKKMEGFILFC